MGRYPTKPEDHRYLKRPLSYPGERERRERNRALFGDLVRHWRLSLHLRQADAARLLNISTQAVWRYEAGVEVPAAKHRHLLRLAMTALYHNLPLYGSTPQHIEETVHPVLARAYVRKPSKVKMLRLDPELEALRKRRYRKKTPVDLSDVEIP